MPGPVDIVFAFLLVVLASIYEYRYFWPRFRADVAAEQPRARRRAYCRMIVGEWLFALGALAIWSRYGRPWSALRLVIPTGWRIVLGGLFVVATIALVVLQLWSVGRLSAERRVKARPQLGDLAFMLPRNREEETWFIGLSITAGFVEELLYRGYLPWLLAPWLGAVGAMAVIVLVFGVSHAYQGRRGVVKATIAGAIMAAVVLSTNSLIAAMIAHALIDSGGGTAGYWLLREANGGHTLRQVPA